MTLAYILIGLVMLVAGAETLVRGASRLAARVGISPLVIGLTVVAFGTSTPEAAVSVQAALGGNGDIAIGNVLGSNIANILLILGLAALVAPLVVARQLVRFDLPVMLGIGVVVYLLARDGQLGRAEGVALLVGIVAYTGVLVALSRRGQLQPVGVPAEPTSVRQGRAAWMTDVLMALAGLLLLGIGGHLLVDGASNLARALGLSELLIGLTVVAVGNSLPELATSMLAALHGHREIAVGNVVGSSIFNLLLVVGLGAVIATDGLSVSPNALSLDFPVMLAVFALCLPVFYSYYRISRVEGALFFVYYLAYLAYAVLFATGLPGLELLRPTLWWGVPITLALVLAHAARAWQRQHR